MWIWNAYKAPLTASRVPPFWMDQTAHAPWLIESAVTTAARHVVDVGGTLGLGPPSKTPQLAANAVHPSELRSAEPPLLASHEVYLDLRTLYEPQVSDACQGSGLSSGSSSGFVRVNANAAGSV